MPEKVEKSRVPLLDLISSGKAQLIKQGAEAKVYKAHLFQPLASASGSSSPPPGPVLLKHRFPKTYRHPHLDATLTRQRLGHEGRCLARAARSGVRVPGVRCVDAASGVLAIEWIEGWTVREILGGGADGADDVEGCEDADGAEDGNVPIWEQLESKGVPKTHLMRLIGEQLALLHRADIIHGDLTTSNMMLRCTSHPQLSRDQIMQPNSDGLPHSWELILIDFGLAHVSTMVEDKAVDLYVLERAFSSTHPEPSSGPGIDGNPAPSAAQSNKPSPPTLYGLVEEAYAKGLGSKEWGAIKRRLEDVRLRGRKRSMVG